MFVHFDTLPVENSLFEHLRSSFPSGKRGRILCERCTNVFAPSRRCERGAQRWAETTTVQASGTKRKRGCTTRKINVIADRSSITTKFHFEMKVSESYGDPYVPRSNKFTRIPGVWHSFRRLVRRKKTDALLNVEPSWIFTIISLALPSGSTASLRCPLLPRYSSNRSWKYSAGTLGGASAVRKCLPSSSDQRIPLSSPRSGPPVRYTRGGWARPDDISGEIFRKLDRSADCRCSRWRRPISVAPGWASGGQPRLKRGHSPWSCQSSVGHGHAHSSWSVFGDLLIFFLSFSFHFIPFRTFASRFSIVRRQSNSLSTSSEPFTFYATFFLCSLRSDRVRGFFGSRSVGRNAYVLARGTHPESTSLWRCFHRLLSSAEFINIGERSCCRINSTQDADTRQESTWTPWRTFHRDCWEERYGSSVGPYRPILKKTTHLPYRETYKKSKNSILSLFFPFFLRYSWQINITTLTSWQLDWTPQDSTEHRETRRAGNNLSPLHAEQPQR